MVDVADMTIDVAVALFMIAFVGLIAIEVYIDQLEGMTGSDGVLSEGSNLYLVLDNLVIIAVVALLIGFLVYVKNQ